MEIKQITKNIQIVCEAKSTRNGFKHEATVFQNGRQVGFAKVNYLNRTWESYAYQTVMLKAVEGSSLSKEEKIKVIKELRERSF